MAFCQNCGKEIADGAKFCDGCGKPVGVAAEDGSKRSQKFLSGGVQYKCPSCGAIVSRTATKCPECGYKIDFKEESVSVKKLVSLIEKGGKLINEDTGKAVGWDGYKIADIIANFDIPVDIQELLEVAIFANNKVSNPYDYEDKAWLGLLKRVNEKAKLLTENKEVTNQIASLTKEAEDKFKDSKKLDIGQVLVWVILLTFWIGVPVFFVRSCSHKKANNEVQSIEKNIESAIDAGDYDKAERFLLDYKTSKKLTEEENSQIESKKDYYSNKIQQNRGKK